MFREKRRRVKLPLRAYLLYLALMSFLLTGVTFSKYVTRSSGGDSARVVKYGTVDISETVPAGGWVIVPGVNITKDATVNVSPSEVDNYIFLKVDVTGWTTTDYFSFNTPNNMLQWSVPGEPNEWTYLTTSGSSYVYYIYLNTNTELHQKAITGDKITVNAAITEDYLATYCAENMIAIDFTAYMVQAGGFASAADAWSAINK